ncbi:MAG: sigma-70 family RNA polymerase sigma factor [Clostridia bacterium]|nr:sigma-70 family RNA polymerase sigma factor [Clostridia bacterium]
MIKEKTIEQYFYKKELDIKQILKDYNSYISTIIKNSTNVSQEDEEEIISDVFFIIWKNKDKLDKKRNLSPYIAGITKKVIYKRYSKYQKQIQIACDAEEEQMEYTSDFNVEKLIEEKEFNQYILNNLDKQEAEIFNKYYFEDKSIKQITKETGLTKSNVKTKLCRIRKKVKDLLKMGGF